MSAGTVVSRERLEDLLRMGGQTLVDGMIAIFLRDTPARLALLADLGAGSAERARAAHSLRSSAANLGLPRLEAVAAQLEAGAAAPDLPAELAAGLAAELEAAHREAVDALRTLASTQPC